MSPNLPRLTRPPKKTFRWGPRSVVWVNEPSARSPHWAISLWEFEEVAYLITGTSDVFHGRHLILEPGMADFRSARVLKHRTHFHDDSLCVVRLDAVLERTVMKGAICLRNGMVSQAFLDQLRALVQPVIELRQLAPSPILRVVPPESAAETSPASVCDADQRSGSTGK